MGISMKLATRAAAQKSAEIATRLEFQELASFEVAWAEGLCPLAGWVDDLVLDEEVCHVMAAPRFFHPDCHRWLQTCTGSAACAVCGLGIDALPPVGNCTPP
ncbi:hypothetical protein ATOBIA_N06140 [Atopobiaceae bacterium P1]|nr:hypothetical protein ATOBIA_N06140 [Atopobiaceae bacterium P1]